MNETTLVHKAATWVGVISALVFVSLVCAIMLAPLAWLVKAIYSWIL